jgi:hypothetical protein
MTPSTIRNVCTILFFGCSIVCYGQNGDMSATPGETTLSRSTTTQPQAKSSTASNADDISESFRCPETLSSTSEKEAALRKFMETYQRLHPEKTVRDLMVDRYRLLVSHSCRQTLEHMTSHITPTTEILRFDGHDFGLDTTEFDSKTHVWTVYFDSVGPPNQEHSDELILNFYSWKPASAPADVAAAFVAPRENMQIIWKFAAPDDVTKELSYFVVLLNTPPGKSYGYLNVTKIGPVAGSAFAATYARKLTGDKPEEISSKARTWLLSEQGKSVFKDIGRVGVEGEWHEALDKPR